MFDLGFQELIVIFIVALLVFGPKRLPELGKSLGKALAELKKAAEGVRDQINAESTIIEHKGEEKNKVGSKQDWNETQRDSEAEKNREEDKIDG